MIGQFCGPYSTVRPAFRPAIRLAKFEGLVQHSVANMSHQENFETYLNELRTNRENHQRPEESMPNFQIDFLEPLEEGQRQIEKGEHDKQDEPGMSQELDDFISSEKSENTLKKTHYQWRKIEMFCKEQTETLMRKTYLLMPLTNSLEIFSKMSVNKMAASTSQTAFQVFKEAFSVA